MIGFGCENSDCCYKAIDNIVLIKLTSKFYSVYVDIYSVISQ